MKLQNLAIVVAACVCLAVLSAPAAAEMIEIQLTGLDLKYDGTDVYDAKAKAGGNGATVEADPLTSVTFLKDGVQVGDTLTTGIFADMFIADVLNIPKGGGAIVTGGNGDNFGFDLLSTSGDFYLQMNVDDVDVIWYRLTLPGGREWRLLTIDGLASSLYDQKLPNSLEIDGTEDIRISVMSNNLTLTDDGTYLTSFNASSVGAIVATQVPEPSTLALAAAGLIGLLGMVWRRRRAR
ncbi:MAG: hypothetical protein A2V70_16485 [Planctomycetes bacterium RBG_13_63_9]|nr:MAG: hypothetical protein A2V70_16485 [Planctomycetes bacterium RBG_13_63_9]